MKMIPPTYDEDTSGGEILLFEALKRCDIEGNCFHSLRLPRHPNPTKPTSEADFVILTPEGLLVVEVKGGGISRDQNGKWIQRGANNHKNILFPGPFAQAEQAEIGLRKRLTELVGEDAVRKTPCGWAVSFPQTRFNVTQFEWDSWQVHDTRHAGPKRTGRWLIKCIKNWQQRLGKGNPPKAVIDTLRKAIRQEFHMVPSFGAAAQMVEIACHRLTKEQINRLELNENEPRLVITGGAGTGKTMLAAEIARTKASEGKRTVLMAPSRYLAMHLESQPQMDEVQIEVAGPRPANVEKCEVLVLDEAQDVLDFDGLQLFDDWVEGGLDRGEWRVFLDHQSQADLAGRFDSEVFAMLCEAASTSHPLPLTQNCRNTGEIVTYVKLLTGADIGVTTNKHGVGVIVEYSSNKEEEARFLANFLRRLEDDNVPPGDVTILSSATNNSCIELLPDRLRKTIKSFDTEVASQRPFRQRTLATPSEFKGLENSFICLVDMEQFGTEHENRDELYVSMTRARTGLWICLPGESKPEFQNRMGQNLDKWT